MKDYGNKLAIVCLCLLISPFMFISIGKSDDPPPSSTFYGNVSLTGGYDVGHFEDIWDLTLHDMQLSFIYVATGLVDELGGAAHAWAELGVRSAHPYYVDFNPFWTWSLSQSFSLIAGQKVEIGTVNVQLTGNLLYVEFVITEDDWFLTETHLAVNESLENIPQTKNNNPIPGQFPYKETHEPPVTYFSYAVPINTEEIVPLYIAAHAAVIKRSIVIEAPYYAFSVVNYEQGLRKDGTAVLPARSDPLQGLEFETGQSESNFFSLGFGGWMVVEFECPIRNDDGNDIKIIEDTWGTYPLETAKIYASQDGNDWSYLGEADNTNSVGIHTISEFDLGGLAWAKYIKIVDTTDPNLHNDAADGFDLNAIEALQDCIEIHEESAWGVDKENPMGFEGKNWATYFMFQDPVFETGSGVWLATDYDWTANTFDPDPEGAPTLDLDDKLILQRKGGQGEGAYDLPSVPPAPGNNHRVWWDRDGVDLWQNAETANTAGIYNIIITLHATSLSTGEAYMNIRGLNQGFETDGDWNTIELTPAGMTFTADMKNLQIFYGLFGYGATHSVEFSEITVSYV